MKSTLKKLGWSLVAVVLCWSPAFAQGQNPITVFAHDALTKHKPGIIAAATEMPADKYIIRAPPDDLTFGYLVWHIADENYAYCSAIGGVPAPPLPEAGEFDPKDRLLERMKASFDFCTTALAPLDDSHMNETLTVGNIKMSRAMAILTIVGNWSTHDTQMESYLPTNGLQPTAK